ncbi:MAG: hypothetical protein KDK39_04535 [Leptospiraceae bacterium]|nr:hypothetical protein [Leptospiraceae bacterium]
MSVPKSTSSSDVPSLELRSLFVYLRSHPELIWQAVRSWPGRLWRYSLGLPERLHHQAELRYRGFALGIAIILICFVTIAHSSPLRLLIPGLAFPIPQSEERSFTELSALSRTQGSIIKVERAFLKKGSLDEQVLRVAQIISQPLDYRDSRPGNTYQALEGMPIFSHAIRKIWFQPDSGLMLIDLRSSSISDELDEYYRNAPVLPAQKLKITSLYFKALTTSLMEQFPEIKTLEYKLDGQRMRMAGLDFDFSERYQR